MYSAKSFHASATLQMLELGLWMWSFAYYIYPSVLLGIILVGTALSGNLVYQQRKRLTAAFSQVNVAPVVRKGYVHAIRVQQLVPGDVVVVQQALAVCDMVLLRGNCLVDESMLTGEVLLLLWHIMLAAVYPATVIRCLYAAMHAGYWTPYEQTLLQRL